MTDIWKPATVHLQFSYDLMTSNSTKDLTPFLQWITIPGDTHQA